MHDAADDSRYAAALSRINSTLRDELEKDDVKTWIPTRVIEQSNPVRFTTTWGGPGRWKSLHGTGNGRPVRSQTELRHADLKDPSYAWELTSEVSLPVTAMTDELDWVLLVVSDIAKSFRREECLAVLQELCRGECQFPATVEGIRLAIGHLNSPKPYPPDRLACRLLSNRQLVKSVRAKDLVDDCFNIGPSLPKGCRGLVLPTVGGPLVERIGEDVTYSAAIAPDQQVRVSLQQRFFITRPQSAAVLVDPPGAVGAPAGSADPPVKPKTRIDRFKAWVRSQLCSTQGPQVS